LIGSAVPDLRGLFLRGYGSQTHSQNNGSVVVVTPTIYSSSALRILQGDTTRNIVGNFVASDDNNGAISGESDFMTGPFFVFRAGGNNPGGGPVLESVVRLDISRVVPTSNEILPINIAVRYLIRALS
jgi:hypothetical protein